MPSHILIQQLSKVGEADWRVEGGGGGGDEGQEGEGSGRV